MTYTWVDYVSLLGPTVLALLTAIIIVIGWFVNSRIALNNEIEKEARPYKIEMCLSIIKFHEHFARLITSEGKVNIGDDELFKLFDDMKSKILLYGGGEENRLLKDLSTNFSTAEKNAGKKNVEEAASHHDISYITNQLLSLSQRKFRKELRLEKPAKIIKVLKSEV